MREAAGTSRSYQVFRSSGGAAWAAGAAAACGAPAARGPAEAAGAPDGTAVAPGTPATRATNGRNGGRLRRTKSSEPVISKRRSPASKRNVVRESMVVSPSLRVLRGAPPRDAAEQYAARARTRDPGRYSSPGRERRNRGPVAAPRRTGPEGNRFTPPCLG